MKHDLPVIAMLLGVVACSPHEGIEPGECVDGFDNDADGLYDCEDDDCARSPDCVEGDADTDADSDTDSDEESGCWNPDTGPDTDNETWYEMAIDTVSYGYDSSAWEYEVTLVGWAESVVLHITQDTSSPWSEDHDFDQGPYDPHGAWDSWVLSLPITSDWSQQQSGENTLYPGTAEMEATMVWRIEAYEHGVVGDCVVWAGYDADASLLMESGCREIAF